MICVSQGFYGLLTWAEKRRKRERDLDLDLDLVLFRAQNSKTHREARDTNGIEMHDNFILAVLFRWAGCVNFRVENLPCGRYMLWQAVKK